MAHAVLLIDDSASDQRMFALAVKASGLNCEIINADSGHLGLAYLVAGGRADLIVVDWRMEGMGGREVLKWLRQSATFSKIPVVVLSGYYEDDDTMESLGAPWFQKAEDVQVYFCTVAKILSHLG